MPGPTGLTADTLRDWKEEEDPTKHWEQVVALVQHIFATREVPAAFQTGAVVLIPKAKAGKYWGIALLESVYKLVASIINMCITKAVKFHTAIHRFQENQSCTTAILEAKIEMQTAKRAGKVYHQIFLDMMKAYDTVDLERLDEILGTYGVGPMVMHVLWECWQDSSIVPRKAGQYGRVVRTERGVQQGDVISPLLFNLVVDAVVQAVDDEWHCEAAEGTVAVSFYADDGRIGRYDQTAVQKYMDICMDLFGRMGLEMNAVKTETLSSVTNNQRTRISHGAYKWRRRGTGAEYKQRFKQQGTCPICGDELQLWSLLRHIRMQHPRVPPPHLELEDICSPPQEEGVWMYHVRMEPRGAKVLCPVARCLYDTGKPAEMRSHFMYRHTHHYLCINGDNYVKCPECSRMVTLAMMEKHTQTAQCKQGVRRQLSRELEEVVVETREQLAVFQIRSKTLKTADCFKYLGRLIAGDDLDLAAALRNIARARAKWGQISRLLQQETASPRIASRFYMAIVLAVLLYGSKMWVITMKIRHLLTVFHNRCTRAIVGTYIRQVDAREDQWIYPLVEETLKKVGLRPLMYYLDKCRITFWDNFA